MKISTEIKIGLTALVTIAVMIWGINYLKGRNILTSAYTLYVQYDNVEGLETSAGVLIDGFKIGTVTEVVYEPGKPHPFLVKLEIDKDYPVTLGSKAELISENLLGTKAINILLSGDDRIHEPDDTLVAALEEDMLTSMMDKIDPITEGLLKTISNLDSTSTALNLVLSDPSLRNTLRNIEGASGSLDKTLSDEGDISLAMNNIRKLSESLENQSESIESTLSNIEEVSADLKNANLDSLLHTLTSTSQNISEITASIKNGNGSAGKLIYDDSLYNQLTLLLVNLDSLINDVNEHPKKYVHFSLF